MQIGALIVAAGMSSRMGQFKPMLNIGSISVAQRVIATLSQSGVSKIVMVTHCAAKADSKTAACTGNYTAEYGAQNKLVPCKRGRSGNVNRQYIGYYPSKKRIHCNGIDCVYGKLGTLLFPTV